MFGVKGVPVPAGAEYVVEEVGSRLAARGHEVVVYVRPHYTPREQHEYRGMRLVHLPSIPSKNFDAITHSFNAAMAVPGEKPDVVHIHSTGNSIFALPLRARGLSTVVTSHGLDWQRAKWGRLAKAYLRFTDFTTARFPNAATAVSQKMQHYYQDHFGRSVKYIPNGVKPVERVEPDEIHRLGLWGDDYILFAARLVPEKCAHHLIEAYCRIPYPTKKLVIAGDGSYGDLYAEKLKQSACDRIIFPGFVRGRLLEELLSNAYLYVLPSEIEGLSTGLLDAMNYENCVLVSDIEENLEVIADAGFSFRTNSVDDLSAKLTQLMLDEPLVREYRRKAGQSVRARYDWEKVTDQYLEIYSSLALSMAG
ncbi:glycosyltransferase family 4 protein [Ornatilinea apprima]|nr:glycosyltransferase family 4 protein [Ornatilinea apprima]